MRKKIFALAGIAMFVLALGVMVHAQEKPSDVSGTWDLTRPGRGGADQTTPMMIEQTGADIKGTIKGARGDAPFMGKVDGKKVDFTVTQQGRNGEVKVEYMGMVEGDTMKGTFKQGDNTVNWSAAKGK